MIKRLPVLLELENDVYEEIELKKPSGGVLSNLRETALKSNSYVALRNLVAGCTERIIGSDNEITDILKIKGALNKTSYNNLEYLSMMTMVDFYNGEDYIEGIYPCKRCGTKVIAEKNIIDEIEIDTRDRVSDLPVRYMDNVSQLTFEFSLEKEIPIKIEDTIENAKILTMTFPTTEHYINAYSMVGDKNLMKFQHAIFANAILKVNGIDVDDRWKRNYGINIFNNTKEYKKDIGGIAKIINSFGIEKRVTKTCKECGRVWQPYIDTSNFFDFGVQ